MNVTLQHYGPEIIAKELQVDEGHPDVRRLYIAIYKSFIEVLTFPFFLDWFPENPHHFSSILLIFKMFVENGNPLTPSSLNRLWSFRQPYATFFW